MRGHANTWKCPTIGAAPAQSGGAVGRRTLAPGSGQPAALLSTQCRSLAEGGPRAGSRGARGGAASRTPQLSFRRREVRSVRSTGQRGPLARLRHRSVDLPAGQGARRAAVRRFVPCRPYGAAVALTGLYTARAKASGDRARRRGDCPLGPQGLAADQKKRPGSRRTSFSRTNAAF